MYSYLCVCICECNPQTDCRCFAFESGQWRNSIIRLGVQHGGAVLDDR